MSSKIKNLSSKSLGNEIMLRVWMMLTHALIEPFLQYLVFEILGVLFLLLSLKIHNPDNLSVPLSLLHFRNARFLISQNWGDA